MPEVLAWSDSHREVWATICRTSPDAWFWHSREWASYQWEYGQPYILDDLSFLVSLQGHAAAICPVFLERAQGPLEGHVELGYGSHPAPAPATQALSTDQRRQVLNAAYREIDRLAYEHRVARCRVVYPTPQASDCAPARLADLQLYGYLDASYLTQVLDLTRGPEDLWRDVRDSYRSLIRRGQRELELNVYDAGNPPGRAFERYPRLHAAAAGRVTRSPATFEMMHRMIRDGSAVLVEGLYEGNPAAYALLLCYRGGAYYGSGCCSPELDLPYLMHALQWTAIEYLRRAGFAWYETGYQCYGPTLNRPDVSKERRISFFKRGMGGAPRLVVGGERYYEPSALEAVMRSRIREYGEALQTSAWAQPPGPLATKEGGRR